MPFIAMQFFLLACTNSISEEAIEPSDTPIKISTNILCSDTRVTDTNFETDDAIGLYVLIQPKKIEQERYIDNIKLTCPDISNLEPESTIYYPAGDDIKCDFISYYPYQESGISEQSNSIETSIQPDQSTDDALSQSDFMVATRKDITPSSKTVALAFRHKLCKVQLILVPRSDEDIDALSHTNPQVLFSGFHTKSYYNFETDQFSSFTESENMIPHGTWQLKNGKLIGKEIYLFPEPLTTESHHIVITVNDNSYTCTFPQDYALESETQNTLVLNYSLSEGLGVKAMNHSIDPWKDGVNGNADTQPTSISISTSNLTFSNSGIYKVMSNGVQVGQICKEYLLVGLTSARAIVAYPFKEGKADLSNGTVISFPGLPQQTVGGKVSWDSTGKLSYTNGSLNSINYLYFTKDHEIVYSAPATPLPIWVESDRLIDIRGDEKSVYSIVKIGTQYWMAENLKATQYTDGNSITKKTSKIDETAGYYTSTNYKFYNAEAVNTGRLAPAGWKVPTETEWSTLKNYLKNNASLMKSGDWKENKNEKAVKNSNLTGFNGTPEGFFTPSTDGKTINHANVGSLADFWQMKDTEDEVSESSAFIFYENNEIDLEGTTSGKGLSVRCIRK